MTKARSVKDTFVDDESLVFDIGDGFPLATISPSFEMSMPMFGPNSMQRMIGSTIRVKLSSAYTGAANGTSENFSTQLLVLYASMNSTGAKAVEQLLNNMVMYPTLTGIAKFEQVKKGMILVRRVSDIIASKPEYVAAFQAIFPADV